MSDKPFAYDMTGDTVHKDDIVQIKPDAELYPGAFLVVTEPRVWGVQGYLCLPMEYTGLTRFRGLAYTRVKTDDYLLVGNAAWVIEPKDGEEDAEKAVEAKPEEAAPLGGEEIPG
jgi:hypothetical protein